MLFLFFKARGEKYAISAKAAIEVAPLVHLTPLPGSPTCVPGLMNHRGQPLPVVDLTVLLAGRASRAWASTRILVCHLEISPGQTRSLGLMAERLLSAKQLTSQPLAPSTPTAPYLAGLFTRGAEVVQIIDPAKILPPEILESLLAQAEATLAA